MAEEEQRLIGGVLPLDDVDSGSIDLAGRFAELIDRLHVALCRARWRPRTIVAWAIAVDEPSMHSPPRDA